MGGEEWGVEHPRRREQPELGTEAEGLGAEGWLCAAHLSLQAGAWSLDPGSGATWALR